MKVRTFLRAENAESAGSILLALALALILLVTLVFLVLFLFPLGNVNRPPLD